MASADATTATTTTTTTMKGHGSSRDWQVDVQAAADATAASPAAQAWTISATHRSTGERHAYANQKVQGIFYSPWIHQARWESLNAGIRYRDSDILIVSYPKCGTTWLEQTTLLLLTGNDTSKLNPASKNVYVPGEPFVGKIWPEACINQDPIFQQRMGKESAPMTWEQFDAAPEPRVLKSHAPMQTLLGTNGRVIESLPPKTKIVVISRNPLDACVSSYYHAFNPAKSGWPFAAWASVWLSGNVPHGPFFSWVRDWHALHKAHPDRVLWLQYEDLQVDAHAETAKLARFLGLGDDEALIQGAVQAASFDSMKAQAAERGGDSLGHLRKGKSGDWTNHFSAELKDEFEAHYKLELEGTGITYSLGHGAGEFSA